MQSYFIALVEEVKFQLMTSNKENQEVHLMRRLGSFRLPILLYNIANTEQSYSNPYFDLAFGSIDQFTGLYPHLLTARRSAGGDYLTLSFQKQTYDAYICPFELDGQEFRLFVMNYRIEYDQLLTSQEKYLLVDIVHKTNDFIAIADEIGNFMYINEAGLKMLKLSPEDVHILNVWDIHNHSELRQILDQGEQGDGSFNWVGQAKIKDSEGNWLYTSQSVTSHFIKGKRFYATVMRDLSMMKRIEAQVTAASSKISQTVQEKTEEMTQLNLALLHEIEASERMRYMLQEREERLSNIVETTLDAFFMVNANLHLERSNRAFKVLVGGTYKELSGERMLRFFTHDAKEVFKKKVSLVERGERVFIELDLQRLDGRVVPCTFSLNPYHTNDGGYKGLFGFIRPIALEDMPRIGDFL
jgi:PAS domain S-box-containing protein